MCFQVELVRPRAELRGGPGGGGVRHGRPGATAAAHTLEEVTTSDAPAGLNRQHCRPHRAVFMTNARAPHALCTAVR
eukprot:6088431-Prymnesium_polylepis.1